LAQSAEPVRLAIRRAGEWKVDQEAAHAQTRERRVATPSRHQRTHRPNCRPCALRGVGVRAEARGAGRREAPSLDADEHRATMSAGRWRACTQTLRLVFAPVRSVPVDL
jgi:hypothetical protein